ncbi:unnamed protein product [Clonostachys rhizophaga]|uniref:Ketoreductase (KR) domain-containing protein n=1 Tax=Clonostachys rhizophaga TaxID=160324 RepID=A0A9N9YND1_9HYPO|nr:unnamed protein product [Clonostachys rhizophaga]
MSRGARNFVFMSHSSINKAKVKKLVARLKDAEANSHVVRGDVVHSNSVALTVRACEESRVESNEAWRKGIQPKWQGTWNLHTPFEIHELDFLLLTSSLSRSHGSATERNYCAPASFLMRSPMAQKTGKATSGNGSGSHL